MELRRISIPEGGQRVYSAFKGDGLSVRWLISYTPFFLVVWFFLGFLLVLPTMVTGADAEVSLLVEPGFSAHDQDWLVPLILIDKEGNLLELPDDDIRVSLGETPVTGLTLGYFAPEPGGYPSSSAVLVDRGFPLEAIGPLVGYLDSGTTDARRALFRCGSRMTALQQPGHGCPSEADLREGLAGEEPTRLWDCLLQAITALGQEGQVRKVLLVISDGDEQLSSEHPLATCIEAARRTRVAVNVLELGDNSGSLSRLRKIARQTGGISIPFTDKSILHRSLVRMDAMRSLRIPKQEPPLPVELFISFGFSTEVTATATVANQTALSGSGIFLVLGLGLGVLVVAGGGVFLLKMKSRKAGLLLVDFQGRQKEVAIPLSGVAMGSDNDNQLVLADERISRHHAVIRIKAGGVILTDLRSRTGTRVNGRSVRNVILRHGDKIILGKAVELTFLRH